MELAGREVPLCDALGLVTQWRRNTVNQDERSARFEADEMARFVSVALCLDAGTMSALTSKVVRRYVEGPTHKSNGTTGRPAAPTQHHRMGAVKTFLDGCRSLGLCPPHWDPTLGIKLPPRGKRYTRPMTTEQLMFCQAVAEAGIFGDRRAATLALAQAGACNQEMGLVLVADVDLDAGTVALRGTSRIQARVNPLTPWGQMAIRQRTIQLGDKITPDSPLLVEPETGQASAASGLNSTLTSILRAASLSKVDGLRPGSIRACGALNAYLSADGVDRLTAATGFLGFTSYDNTAAFIGLSDARESSR